MARRSMAYSNMDGCSDGGRTMYSNTTEEWYDNPKHGHGHGHIHGMTNMYANTTTDVESFDARKHGHGHGHGGGRTMSYSNTTEEECYGGEQGYYKREEQQHMNREHVGEVGALATGASALNKGHGAKKGPVHTPRLLLGRIRF